MLTLKYIFYYYLIKKSKFVLHIICHGGYEGEPLKNEDKENFLLFEDDYGRKKLFKLYK